MTPTARAAMLRSARRRRRLRAALLRGSIDAGVIPALTRVRSSHSDPERPCVEGDQQPAAVGVATSPDRPGGGRGNAYTFGIPPAFDSVIVQRLRILR